MKRNLTTLTVLLLLIAPAYIFCQSINKANSLYKSNKLQDAKTEIDKVMAIEQNRNDAEAWYTKSKIFSGIAGNEKLSANYPGIRNESFEAIQKYRELTNGNVPSLKSDKYKTILDIYTGYFKTGASFYNAKNFSDALENFKHGLEVSQFMFQNGWSTLQLDTTVLLYAGISAEKANNNEVAASYYSILAENRAYGEGMVEIYKWLADYYYKKKGIQYVLQIHFFR